MLSLSDMRLGDCFGGGRLSMYIFILVGLGGGEVAISMFEECAKGYFVLICDMIVGFVSEGVVGKGVMIFHFF